MKNPLIAGAIAGVVVYLVLSTTALIFSSLNFLVPAGGWEVWVRDLPTFLIGASVSLSLNVIWGMILGWIYSRLYDSIPSKGVMKGLYYGLLIWLFKDILAGSYVALMYFEILMAIHLIIYGFFMWTAFGLVLGYLYKPTK